METLFQEKHGFWFDIQDVTGTTLSAKARFQINMNVPKIANYDDLAHINTTVIPILWMEEGIDELGPEIIGVLKQAVTEPREWRQIILWVCLGMFATLVVLAGVALARVILNRSKVERVRENLESIISNGLQHENHCQLIQPMLQVMNVHVYDRLVDHSLTVVLHMISTCHQETDRQRNSFRH